MTEFRPGEWVTRVSNPAQYGPVLACEEGVVAFEVALLGRVQRAWPDELVYRMPEPLPEELPAGTRIRDSEIKARAPARLAKGKGVLGSDIYWSHWSEADCETNVPAQFVDWHSYYELVRRPRTEPIGEDVWELGERVFAEVNERLSR